MPIGLRCAVVALCFSLAGAAVAVAQDEKPGGWTDPPVRGAAGSPAEAAKPAAEAPAKPAETPAETAAKPPEAAPAPTKAADAPAARTSRRASAKPRREAIRRAAARSGTERAKEASIRRGSPRMAADDAPRIAARRAASRATPRLAGRASTHRAAAIRPRDRTAWRGTAPTARRYALRSPRFGAAEPIDADDEARRDDWDDRVSRLERARAAGFLIMRSRTILYPDGSHLRMLRPLDLDGFD